MLPRSQKDSRIHPDCPPEVVRAVDVMLATSLVRQPILSTETLGDVVKRLCPQVAEIPAVHGFELRFDLPENSRKNLSKSRIFYQIRRKAAR